MLQVNNKSPFLAQLTVMPDANGVDALYVAIKATFIIDQRELKVAPEPSPIFPADVFWGDPASSSVRYAGELHPPKRATDVVLVGDGYAPGGRPAPYFGVSIAVGQLKKIIHVYGNRVWIAGLTVAPSAPQPATQVPLVYEKAYGGRQELPDGTFLAEMRNPVGIGFRGKRAASEMANKPVPNLDHPRSPICSLSDQPPPAALGYVAPAWQPRASFAGTYDEKWKKKRAPYLPADFDPRFWQSAPPDQVYPGFLRGGEPVELINASPVGVQRFSIPTCQLDAAAVFQERIAPLPLSLDTLLLEPGENRFSLLWHGTTSCDKEMLKLQAVFVTLEKMEGASS